MSLASLIERWRGEAELFRRRKQDGLAALVESYADELEIHLRMSASDSVSLTEGALLSGYSPDHLGRLIREGVVENVGKKHAPRIRVMDLPRKPGCASEDPTVPVLQLEHGRRPSGLEKAVEHRGLRVQRGGDAP